jgi:hypothetical protein
MARKIKIPVKHNLKFALPINADCIIKHNTKECKVLAEIKDGKVYFSMEINTDVGVTSDEFNHLKEEQKP